MININVYGIFHGEKLAFQLSKKLKTRLLSSYPRFIFKRTNHFFIYSTKLHLINYFFQKYIKSKKIVFYVDRVLRVLHYKLTKVKSTEGDTLIFWANTSNEFVNFIELKKTKLVLEKGNTHSIFRNQILKEEYKNLNIDYIENDSTKIESIEYEISNYIVVPSDFVKKTFIENGIDSDKIFVNPYGVNLADFKRVEIKKDKFRIIFVGKACLRKGFQYLIEAMKKLEQYEIELWHVGSVSEEIKTLDFRLKNITYHGTKAENKLYEYYNQCDVFVLPSLEEGLAMVTLQAMACGLPVICTPNTGIENVLTKNGEEGFVIPIRDPNAIVERVLELYNDKELRIKMGNKALEKVQNGFTWDDYGKRYIDFLNKISNE